MQDGVHLFCHPKFRFTTSLPSIFTAQHTVKFPPKGPSSSPPKAPGPSPLPQEPGGSPSRSPLVQFGSPDSKGVSTGRAWGLFGGSSVQGFPQGQRIIWKRATNILTRWAGVVLENTTSHVIKALRYMYTSDLWCCKCAVVDAHVPCVSNAFR